MRPPDDVAMGPRTCQNCDTLRLKDDGVASRLDGGRFQTHRQAPRRRRGVWLSSSTRRRRESSTRLAPVRGLPEQMAPWTTVPRAGRADVTAQIPTRVCFRRRSPKTAGGPRAGQRLGAPRNKLCARRGARRRFDERSRRARSGPLARLAMKRRTRLLGLGRQALSEGAAL